MTIYPIARVEKLMSSLKTLTLHENVEILKQKIGMMRQNQESSTAIQKVFKQIEKKQKNNELLAAKAVGLQDFNDSGFIDFKNIEQENESSADLTPFNQAYRSPYLLFGY